MLDSIAPYVGERLGFYVYLYVDPRSNEPFYVGKGQGDRVLAHLADMSESQKVARIKEILAGGLKPQIDILVHGLPSEEAAFRIEIESWHPERTTPYHVRVFEDPTPMPGRWEFIGKPAEEGICKQYVGRSVQHYFKQGLQSPVVYVNCIGMPAKTRTSRCT